MPDGGTAFTSAHILICEEAFTRLSSISCMPAAPVLKTTSTSDKIVLLFSSNPTTTELEPYLTLHISTAFSVFS